GGRTESTTELTDAEIIDVRAELAAMETEDDDTAPDAAPADVDPETGEITSAVNPLARNLKQRVAALREADMDAYGRFRTWLEEHGLADKPINGFSAAELYTVADWLGTEEANGEPF
ncbi:MAG: hypothetical protein LC798_19630, partial [Chloroflexi bacterium]|nr:hypothetical protein [Chloroflexota bacterium]